MDKHITNIQIDKLGLSAHIKHPSFKAFPSLVKTLDKYKRKLFFVKSNLFLYSTCSKKL